jgi:preprotein translocase subunit SecD
MQRKLMWRWLLIGAVTAAAVFFMWPPDKKIHLGLDLKGGIHLVLQVNTQDALRAEIDDVMERVRVDLTEKGFAPASLQRLSEGNGFEFGPASNTPAKTRPSC